MSKCVCGTNASRWFRGRAGVRGLRLGRPPRGARTFCVATAPSGSFDYISLATLMPFHCNKKAKKNALCDTLRHQPCPHCERGCHTYVDSPVSAKLYYSEKLTTFGRSDYRLGGRTRRTFDEIEEGADGDARRPWRGRASPRHPSSPAMSRCAHETPSANSLMKAAAVSSPPCDRRRFDVRDVGT